MKIVLIIVMIIGLFYCSVCYAENPFAEQIKVDDSSFSGLLVGSGDDVQEVLEHLDQGVYIIGTSDIKLLLVLILITLIIIALILWTKL